MATTLGPAIYGNCRVAGEPHGEGIFAIRVDRAGKVRFFPPGTQGYPDGKPIPFQVG